MQLAILVPVLVHSKTSVHLQLGVNRYDE